MATQVIDSLMNWRYTFANLEKFDSANALIAYTLTENPIADYTTVIQDLHTDGSQFEITNTHILLTNIQGTKTWDDAANQDGIRPESVIVRLLADGQEIDSATVTEATGWKFEFNDLPIFKTIGETISTDEIQYTVKEDAVADYTTTITGYDITNSYTPGETSLTVNKVWDDANNQTASVQIVFKSNC